MVGRQQLSFEINDDLQDKTELDSIMTNSHINGHFQNLAREVCRFFNPFHSRNIKCIYLEVFIGT